MNDKETLEEAAQKRFPINYNLSILERVGLNSAANMGFIEGAKWQAEKMYSEDDMIMFADFFHNYKELLKKEKWEILELSKKDILKKWFEKFKKK